MSAIQINNVTKRYKNVTALDHVSFSFRHGKIYGFLGRNGAGKSTLINIIANRIFADEGTVFIDGLPDLYASSLKIKDLFKWIDRFYDSFDLKKAFQTAEKFDLDVTKRFKALSKGYQSIVKLTAALALNVPYVIFDEPVLGLDANHRELFYNLLLKNFEDNDQTIIIATHLIEEVANIIEEVVLIDKGKLLLQENVDTLLERGYCVSGLAEEVDSYCKDKNVIGNDELGGLKLSYIIGEETKLPQGSHLQITRMNLQKLFIKLTEKGGDE